MNEVVGRNGLRVVKQKLCSTLDDAMSYAKDELKLVSSVTATTITPLEGKNTDQTQIIMNNHQIINQHTGILGQGRNDKHASSLSSYCVVKPCRGVASDDVYFCKTLEDVKEAFQRIHETPVFGCANGSKHESVLVQEFAKGTEYAIDIVSKNGEHKVATLWRYDKRPCNDAPFVYFATEIINAQSGIGKQVCEYAKKVLDTLNIKWGLCHIEIILDGTNEDDKNREDPVLVEVNCRQHNTDFVPLTSISIGYNALDMLLAAYLGDGKDLPEESEHLRLEWESLPELSEPRAFAAIVHLVSYVEGEIIAINQEALEEIESLPSVLGMEIYDHFGVGNIVRKTTDIRSDSGWVHLMNDDEEQFISDYNRIVELMPTIFIVS